MSSPNPDKKLCAYALYTLIKLGNILTLFQPTSVKKEESDDPLLLEKIHKIALKYQKDTQENSIEGLLKLILDIREKARKEKDWNTSDNIRKDLDEIGYEIQDTSDGPVWRKK